MQPKSQGEHVAEAAQRLFRRAERRREAAERVDALLARIEHEGAIARAAVARYKRREAGK